MHHREARCVMQFLAVAFCPVSIDVVAEAVAVDCENEIFSPEYRLQDPDDILEICSSLVVLSGYILLCVLILIYRRELRFAHYSVKEYLFSTRIEHAASHSFKVSEGPGHRLVTRISLIYLLSFEGPTLNQPEDDPDLDVSDLYWPKSVSVPEYSLLHYAAQFWYQHYKTKSLEGLEEHALATKLFDPTSSYRFVHWLQTHDPDLVLWPSKDNFAPPLYYSSLLGLCSVTEWLLKRQVGVNINSRRMYINAEGGNFGNALQAASYHGSKEVVQLLLEHGANINAEGGEFGNALQVASYNGSKEVVQLLLEHGANINAEGGHFGNALQAASYNGGKEMVQLLLEHGAKINAEGGKYGNALQAASYHGSKEVVQLLLEHGANINAEGGHFGNALQAASCYGGKQVVQLLLEHGANINVEGGKYGNALQAASYFGSKEVVQLLLEHGAKINAEGN